MGTYNQVLITNLQGNFEQLEGRVNNQILGVKGLIFYWIILYQLSNTHGYRAEVAGIILSAIGIDKQPLSRI